MKYSDSSKGYLVCYSSSSEFKANEVFPHEPSVQILTFVRLHGIVGWVNTATAEARVRLGQFEDDAQR